MRTWLKIFRKEKGLSQQEAAVALDMSVRGYQRIESGESFPARKYQHRLANLFGLQVFDFLASEEKNRFASGGGAA